MPTYNRTRTKFNGVGYIGRVERWSPGFAEFEESFDLPLLWSQRSVCQDVDGERFTTVAGVKVEVDHDLLLDHRSFRYRFGNVDEGEGVPSSKSRLSAWGYDLATRHIAIGCPPKLASDALQYTEGQGEWLIPLALDHVVPEDFPLNPVADLLGRTNLTKPSVDVPAFLGELRDVPRMFRMIGDSLVRTSGNSFLSYNFGWRPFISDIRKMTTAVSQGNKLMVHLRKLLTSGISRSARLAYGTNQEMRDLSYPLIEFDPTFRDVDWKVDIWTESELWGYTRWFMPESARLLYKLDDHLLKAAALRTVLGAGVHPSAVWELIPWSWLIDWFADFQDILELLVYRPIPIDFGGGGVCFKRHTIADVLCVNPPEDFLDPHIGFLFNRVTKRRDIFSDAINTVSIPGTSKLTLSTYQLSILSALVASKRKFAFF